MSNEQSGEKKKKVVKKTTTPDTTNTGARTQAFHDFYSQVFTAKRWQRLYTALSEPTDLVALINPYVHPRWIAKELGVVNALQSKAFNPAFTKGLPIFELTGKNAAQAITAQKSGSTLDSIPLESTNALDSVEDKGFVSRWPIKLPQVGHQPGDNQLDIAIAQQAGVDQQSDSDDDNPFQGEHIAVAGGYVSGFGPTRDKLGWYLMDLASIAAPLILNPQPGEKVLDLCAAPGGKSLILAYLMLFRDQLPQRAAAIHDTMARFVDATRLNSEQQIRNSQFTTFQEEESLPLNDGIASQFAELLATQQESDFAEFTQPVSYSKKKLSRFVNRFEGLYDDDGCTLAIATKQTTADPEDGPNNNQIEQQQLRIKSRVAYEDDEIIRAIYTSRNHISTLKTKNELDRDRHLERQRAIDAAQTAKAIAQSNKALDAGINNMKSSNLGDFDDDEDDTIEVIAAVDEMKQQEQGGFNSTQQDPNAAYNTISEVDLVQDLQYQRDVRQLHAKILNPLALRKQMDVSATSSGDDENGDGDDAGDDGDFKAQANKIITTRGNNQQSTLFTPPTEAELEQRRLRREAKLAEKDRLAKEKEMRRVARQKLTQQRLRSRLVLNDVSIPRVKRLQKVIQSYLPMKYVPLIEITNVDASTAQQFTLITRNSQGDVSVKKIQKKGSGSALDSKDVQERAKAGEYDAVLVDAPCSSDRHIIHDDALATWNVGYTKMQAKRQYGLLLAAIKSLKVGGRCVYSTCSLSPFENDGVVQQVIKTLGEDVVKVIKFKLDIGERTGVGWILLPDQPNCQWGPLYISFLQRIG